MRTFAEVRPGDEAIVYIGPRAFVGRVKRCSYPSGRLLIVLDRESSLEIAPKALDTRPRVCYDKGRVIECS